MRPFFLLIAIFLFFVSCKKDSVDATSTQTFQASINDMASSLSTLEQVKFNEALYILKTFGVDGENEIVKLDLLGKKLNGKKVPEILALADQVARENEVDWSSTGPPSLGEMNIFASTQPTEFDPNDISAAGLTLATIEIEKDSVLGPKALQVIPRLVDRQSKPIEFSGAALETILEVTSGGRTLQRSKNLMLDNEFKGFTVRLNALSIDQVIGGEIDIHVTVRTTDKDYKMSKIGVPVNTMALKTPQVSQPVADSTSLADAVEPLSGNVDSSTPSSAGEPKTTVIRFLNQLGAQNLRGAYEVSANPSWGSYESFANPTTGFGALKSVKVNNISSVSSGPNSAVVSATYDVTSKDGSTTALQVHFGLKNVKDEWKITSYTIKP